MMMIVMTMIIKKGVDLMLCSNTFRTFFFQVAKCYGERLL